MIPRWKGDPHPIKLKPCPLCGASAEVLLLETGPATLNATIRCTRCGLTLKWETEIFAGHTARGDFVAYKYGLDPFEAWNRRAGEKER